MNAPKNSDKILLVGKGYMARKSLLLGFGIVLIAASSIFAFGEFLDKSEEGQTVIPENQSDNEKTDLFPPRSQERIIEAENKDTAFEEAEEVKKAECSDFYCFEKRYQDLVVSNSIAAAFFDLKVRYDESAQVRSLCHPLVHVIGRAAAKKYSDVGEAYRKGDHFCWSGYYHGVMEGILREAKPEDLPDVINNICKSIPGKEVYSFDYYNCVHGLGHGVMYVTQNELFEALILCDSLEGVWERESCYGGVFMENVITDFENHFTNYLKPEEPLYPCTEVPEKNKHQCYLMQTSYVLKTNGYNFVDAFEQCSTVEDEHKNTCYQSIGRDASGSTVSDTVRTKAYCMLGTDSRQLNNCVVGAVKDFVSYFHSDVQAKQLCEAFLPDIEEICLDTVAVYYQSFQ